MRQPKLFKQLRKLAQDKKQQETEYIDYQALRAEYDRRKAEEKTSETLG